MLNKITHFFEKKLIFCQFLLHFGFLSIFAPVVILLLFLTISDLPYKLNPVSPNCRDFFHFNPIFSQKTQIFAIFLSLNSSDYGTALFIAIFFDPPHTSHYSSYHYNIVKSNRNIYILVHISIDYDTSYGRFS